MKELLIQLNACQEAKDWAENKTWKEVYDTCHRGDWLLWLHLRTNVEDLHLRTLAKGHCANTVRHLMKDERSIKAVDAAILFGEGKITQEELNDAANAANEAAANAANAVNAADMADMADTAYVVAAAAYAAANAANATAAARIKNQKETADIVRKYIPFESWNVQKLIRKLKSEK